MERTAGIALYFVGVVIILLVVLAAGEIHLGLITRARTWWEDRREPVFTHEDAGIIDAGGAGSLREMRKHSTPPPELRPVLKGAPEVNAVHSMLSPIDKALEDFRAAYDVAFAALVAPLDPKAMIQLNRTLTTTTELDMRDFRKMLVAEALLVAA